MVWVYAPLMSGMVTWKAVRRRAAAMLVAFIVGVWLAALASPPALADEGDNDQASVFVLQAIGCIVNTPNDMDQIQEKIDDALKAPDTEGVDLTQVKAAKAALDNGNMDRARTLLQESLQGGAPMPVAAGEETGTTVVHDVLNPRGNLAGGDWVLLAISVVVLALGAWLAVRYRPHESVRILRRQLRSPSSPTPSS
jgi:hypothetical protein